MDFYIGITDEDWFAFLRKIKPDETNFWRPLARQSFRAIQPGEPFLFKLHYPMHYIVGGGFFVSYSRLPLSVAWDSFGEKNGASDIDTVRANIHKYREKRDLPFTPNPNIGCIILNDPFFFDENDWIPAPSDWSANIVQGKTYSTDEVVGAEVWQKVLDRLEPKAKDSPSSNSTTIRESQERYGSEYITRARLGQGAFRVLVAEAYENRCAITGEGVLPALQAVHIKPYSESGPHAINNGLMLRADLHLLFDAGYITINKTFEVLVSKQLHEEFPDSGNYYSLHGKHLAIIPETEEKRPAVEYIEWHNKNRFIG